MSHLLNSYLPLVGTLSRVLHRIFRQNHFGSRGVLCWDLNLWGSSYLLVDQLVACANNNFWRCLNFWLMMVLSHGCGPFIPFSTLFDCGFRDSLVLNAYLRGWKYCCFLSRSGALFKSLCCLLLFALRANKLIVIEISNGRLFNVVKKWVRVTWSMPTQAKWNHSSHLSHPIILFSSVVLQRQYRRAGPSLMWMESVGSGAPCSEGAIKDSLT